MASLTARSTSLVAVAPLLLVVAGAFACSAPPGAVDEDDEGPPPFMGVGTPGTSTGGLQPAPAGNNPVVSGAGGASSFEAPGSNAGFNPPPAQNNNGGNNNAQAPNAMQPAGAAGAPSQGAAGSSGMMAPGAGGGSAMPPATPTPMQPPVTQPPVTQPPVTQPPVTPPPVVQPPPAGNAGCPGQFLCEGFENVPAGELITSPPWQVIDGYAADTQSANVLVSNAQAHSGTQSLRVLASGARNGIVATLPQNRYFLRAWLRVDAAPLGPVFIGLGTDQNSETRLRIQGNGLATINAVGGTAGDLVRPAAATSGNCTECVPMPVNTWFCAEFAIDQATQSATLSIDGEEAASIVNGQGGWAPQPAQPKLFLGSMGLQGGTTGVFIDDVAVGSAPIGCN